MKQQLACAVIFLCLVSNCGADGTILTPSVLDVQEYFGSSGCAGPVTTGVPSPNIQRLCTTDHRLLGSTVIFDFGSPRKIGSFRHHIVGGDMPVAPNEIENLSFYNSDPRSSGLLLAEPQFAVTTSDSDGLFLQFEPVVAQYAVWSVRAPTVIEERDGWISTRRGYVHSNTDGIRFFAVPEPSHCPALVLLLFWWRLNRRASRVTMA